MKTLVAICALVACCAANPGLVYSSGWAPNLGLVGAPGLIAARTGLIGGFAAPAYAAYAPSLITTRTIATAPVLTTTSAVATAPAVVATAPTVVAAAPAAVVATAPAVVEARTVAAAPVVAAAPAVVAAAPATKTQWHAQTELGQATYGHTEPLQAHSAAQDAHGNKVGSFSYLNPHDGQIHRTDYVADALGYRAVANDLPIDTPEVALAKAAHLAAHRQRRDLAYSAIATPWGLAASPLVAASPVIAAAPAVRDAVLTTVVNNPGHAVSYRID